MARLDRNRTYGTVYGDPKRSYYQDGKFFDPKGQEVDASGDPLPEAEDEKPRDEDTSPASVAETDDSKAKRIKALSDLHVSKLKKLAGEVAEQLGVEAPDLKGKGVKAKLVKWIADNTN